MASRATRLSLSACGLSGLLSPLNNRIAGKRLDAEPAHVMLLHGGPQSALIFHHLRLGGVRRADHLQLVRVFLDELLDVRPVVGRNAGEAGQSALLGPVQGLDEFFNRAVIMLAAFFQARDPPQVDILLLGRPAVLPQTPA